jgi:hypothetical protein
MNNPDKNELKTIFAHALLTGLANNGHLLKANASGEEIGHMVRIKVEGIVAGYTEDDDDDKG